MERFHHLKRAANSWGRVPCPRFSIPPARRREYRRIFIRQLSIRWLMGPRVPFSLLASYLHPFAAHYLKREREREREGPKSKQSSPPRFVHFLSDPYRSWSAAPVLLIRIYIMETLKRFSFFWRNLVSSFFCFSCDAFGVWRDWG